MKGETQELNLVIWIVFTALSLQARYSPCPSQLSILTYTTVMCLLTGSEAQSVYVL